MKFISIILDLHVLCFQLIISFSRLYPVSSSQSNDIQYLSISHSGVRLVRREKSLPTDYLRVSKPSFDNRFFEFFKMKNLMQLLNEAFVILFFLSLRIIFCPRVYPSQILKCIFCIPSQMMLLLNVHLLFENISKQSHTNFLLIQIEVQILVYSLADFAMVLRCVIIVYGILFGQSRYHLVISCMVEKL